MEGIRQAIIEETPLRTGNRNIASGAFLFVFGLFWGLQSFFRHSFWERGEPGPGFFPLLISFMIMGLSLAIFLPAFLERGKRNEEDTSPPSKGEINLLRVAMYGLLILLYGALMEKGGFLLTSTLFLLVIYKMVERQSWQRTLIMGFASIIVSYLLFAYFLGVPLPRGVITWF